MFPVCFGRKVRLRKIYAQARVYLERAYCRAGTRRKIRRAKAVAGSTG